MLISKFNDLPNAESADSFTALPLSTTRKDFLTRSVDGAPIFLLHDSSPIRYLPGIQFRYISVQFHSTCRVQMESAAFQGQFAVISCSSEAVELYELFINCFSASIENLPNQATTRQLESSIQDLLDLFRDMTRPNTREISGLWAELFTIDRSANSVKMIDHWHDDPYNRFDFSWDNKFLEVKSTVQTSRIHEFSLDQLITPPGTTGYIASLLLQPFSGGMGVMDIARNIDALLQEYPQLRKKLWTNVAKALGSDFSEKIDRRFDASFSERNLILYNMNDIPRLEDPLDSRIKNIRYQVTLDTVRSSLIKPSLEYLSDKTNPLND